MIPRTLRDLCTYQNEEICNKSHINISLVRTYTYTAYYPVSQKMHQIWQAVFSRSSD